MGFVEGWKRIFDTSQFAVLYPNVAEIVFFALIVPLSNGNVERIFSQQNLIKTKVRNQMKLKTLNSHIMIVIKAYDIWQRLSRRI